MKREEEIAQILDSLRKAAFYVGHGKYCKEQYSKPFKFDTKG